jgi:hypothetical protein
VSLHNRLRRLEAKKPPTGHPGIVCVDEAGHVLDDGCADLRPWVGMNYAELPFAVTALVGVDPRQVLGLDIGNGCAEPPGNGEDKA